MAPALHSAIAGFKHCVIAPMFVLCQWSLGCQQDEPAHEQAAANWLSTNSLTSWSTGGSLTLSHTAQNSNDTVHSSLNTAVGLTLQTLTLQCFNMN